MAEAILLSLRDVAHLLHCGPAQVMELVRSGRMPIRQAWRQAQAFVSLADVLRFEDRELPVLDPETWERVRKAGPLRRVVKSG